MRRSLQLVAAEKSQRGEGVRSIFFVKLRRLRAVQLQQKLKELLCRLSKTTSGMQCTESVEQRIASVGIAGAHGKSLLIDDGKVSNQGHVA